MSMQPFQPILQALPSMRVGVFGDFCLDCYWDLRVQDDVLSIETGLPVRRFEGQRYSLGGAGNVAMNLRALGVESVTAFGVIGDDPFARQMRATMASEGIHHAALLQQDDDWCTPTYIKPLKDGIEQNRLDHGSFNRLDTDVGRELINRLRSALPALDVVIVNQQLPPGLHTNEVAAGLVDVAAHTDVPFIVDSRDFPDCYDGMMRKVNAAEVMRAAGAANADLNIACETLFTRWQKPFAVTCGADGCLVVDEIGLMEAPGYPAHGPTDPVGAGDTFVAAFAAAIGTGCNLLPAAMLANAAAAVTVSKINQTGTATPEEISVLCNKSNTPSA
jgi:rfaE bifunctional protein kinase chain/domain